MAAVTQEPLFAATEPKLSKMGNKRRESGRQIKEGSEGSAGLTGATGQEQGKDAGFDEGLQRDPQGAVLQETLGKLLGYL